MVMAARKREHGLIDTLELVFLRIVAFIFLAIALQYWVLVTGASGNPALRFDTMADHWRLASSVLSVLLPVAALGLWSGASWGIVLWLAAALIAFAMHGWYAALFGRADLLVAFHTLGLLVVAAFRISARIVANRK